jgi:hypothetical protein
MHTFALDYVHWMCQWANVSRALKSLADYWTCLPTLMARSFSLTSLSTAVRVMILTSHRLELESNGTLNSLYFCETLDNQSVCRGWSREFSSP